MIKITFILPYHELGEMVDRFVAEYPSKEQISITKVICIVDKHKLEQMHFEGDIVIARGITAALLKKHNPNISLIEIPVTGYDIIRAYAACKKRFGSKKIACIGSANMIYGLPSLKDGLDFELACYLLEKDDDADRLIRYAVEAGADAVIGGSVVHRTATALGVPSVLIELGSEAVRQVLDEALRTVEITRNERERAELFKTIMDYSYEGIVAVNSTGHITVFNQCAADIAKLDRSYCIGKHIHTVLPTLPLNKVTEKGEGDFGCLFTINKSTVIANCVPIFLGTSVVGATATFQKITKIQEVEEHIRKKTHEKGLVAKYRFTDIIGNSKPMVETVQIAQEYSKTDYNVLLIGETGTGKELFAHSIHNLSDRKKGPFVAVNCAAIPEHLLESELFGYVEGAFTGAAKGGKQGYFELAHHGTIFLDEISELPPKLQGRLLRVLQEKEIMRIGADRVIPVNVRIISATNRNLRQLVNSGHFRQDLLYRLDVLRLLIPPLRQRKEDIEPLIKLALNQARYTSGKPIQHIAPAVFQMLQEYPWPGNVRELKNFCERLSISAQEGYVSLPIAEKVMGFDDFPQELTDHTTFGRIRTRTQGTHECEAATIRAVLIQCNNNKTAAAKLLGIHITTLWRKMKRYQLEGYIM